MSSPPGPSRVAAARAKQASRRLARQRLGRLRDCRVKPATLKRYRKHVSEFFRWLRLNGRAIPATAGEFDVVISSYAECLWEGGESRSILANTLSGVQHLVPGTKKR